MVDHRHVHGAEHAIRHWAGAGNLQKMASLMLRHDFLTFDSLIFLDFPAEIPLPDSEKAIFAFNFFGSKP
jgi:hypothetical protein